MTFVLVLHGFQFIVHTRSFACEFKCCHQCRSTCSGDNDCAVAMSKSHVIFSHTCRINFLPSDLQDIAKHEPRPESAERPSGLCFVSFADLRQASASEFIKSHMYLPNADMLMTVPAFCQCSNRARLRMPSPASTSRRERETLALTYLESYESWD